MNKEEVAKHLQKDVIKEKVISSTNLLMDMYELGFNNGFDLIQSQLDIANKKLDKIKETINSFLDNWECGGALTEYHITGEPPSKDLQDILSIIGGE